MWQLLRVDHCQNRKRHGRVTLVALVTFFAPVTLRFVTNVLWLVLQTNWKRTFLKLKFVEQLFWNEFKIKEWSITELVLLSVLQRSGFLIPVCISKNNYVASQTRQTKKCRYVLNRLVLENTIFKLFITVLTTNGRSYVTQPNNS